jgi:sec-independent protein translocase protein TatA
VFSDRQPCGPDLRSCDKEITMIAEIFSPDILIVLVVIALLFGGSQLPKLARSLGSAKGEFEKGMKEGEQKSAAEKAQREAAEKAAASDDDA